MDKNIFIKNIRKESYVSKKSLHRTIEMGTYNVPRNVKGEGRILFIFTPKSLIYTVIGVAIGLLFYFIFSIVKLKVVGVIFVVLFALIGLGIGSLKVPSVGIIKATKVVAGENIDDVIKRAVLFKRKANKIYVYDDKEVKTNDK